jgi:hypothetical protein
MSLMSDKLQLVASLARQTKGSSDQVVNTLECGDLSPLWPAAAGRRFFEKTQPNVVAIGRDRPKR